MSIERCPSKAAIASRLMPRLIDWVASVWRSWWGWTWPIPARLATAGHVAMDGAPVEGPTVVTLEEVTRAGRSAHGPVLADEIDQHRVQRHVAVVVQLADGDAQTMAVSLADHGVVFEPGELADAHPGAGQQLDHEPTAQVGVLGQRGHELGGRRIVQELGQRLVEGREVARCRWTGGPGRRRSPTR